MSIEPEAGLVIRYDFLWKQEHEKGQEHGTKDRPCAIILASKKHTGKTREVVICPITHTPPNSGETSIEIPYKVARYLGLDHEKVWIKTHEVNMIEWEDGRIPYGITRTPSGNWTYGIMPRIIGQKAFEQVRENSRKKSINITKRD